jgi:hypothetical protein
MRSAADHSAVDRCANFRDEFGQWPRSIETQNWAGQYGSHA